MMLYFCIHGLLVESFQRYSPYVGVAGRKLHVWQRARWKICYWALVIVQWTV